jgi:hypothetical protein
LAYKWGRIRWRCWQDGVPYDEEKYLDALSRKKSPLVKLLGVKQQSDKQSQQRIANSEQQSQQQIENNN